MCFSCCLRDHSATSDCTMLRSVQVAPKEVLFPNHGLSRSTGRCLSYPPMPLQATPVKLGSEFPEPTDAVDKLERQVTRFSNPA